jgi:hypothetical protein
MKTATFVSFPHFIGGITGIAYARIGSRKVWATLTDGATLSIPRKEFPPVLPNGNEFAFMLASKIASGPSV